MRDLVTEIACRGGGFERGMVRPDYSAAPDKKSEKHYASIETRTSTANRRKELEEQISAFLASGGHITKV